MTKDASGIGPHGPVSEQFMRHYYGAKRGEPCPHRMCFKGTHKSFQKELWLCADCGEFVDLKHLDEYGVVMAALKREQ